MSLKSLFAGLCLLASCSAMASPPAFETLQFKSLQGQSTSIQKYQGQLLLVNFWATWCPPCVKELPAMVRLKTALADKPFEIIAIAVGEDDQVVQQFMSKHKFNPNFVMLTDAEGVAFGSGIRGLPTSYLVTAEGELVETIVGPREWDSAEQIEAISAHF